MRTRNLLDILHDHRGRSSRISIWLTAALACIAAGQVAAPRDVRRLTGFRSIG